jgi:hypothetical protein
VCESVEYQRNIKRIVVNRAMKMSLFQFYRGIDKSKIIGFYALPIKFTEELKCAPTSVKSRVYRDINFYVKLIDKDCLVSFNGIRCSKQRAIPVLKKPSSSAFTGFLLYLPQSQQIRLLSFFCLFRLSPLFLSEKQTKSTLYR